MTASLDLAELRERVRDACDWPLVAGALNLMIRKAGPATWKCSCPFHAEKTPSFTMGGRHKDRCICFGCGEKGDYFDFWGKLRGVDHVQAVKDLAGLSGVHVGEIHFEKPKAGAVRTPEKRLDVGDANEKPSLPPLFKLNAQAADMIAQTRHLDAEAVWTAARVFRRVAYSAWPLHQRGNARWMPRCEAHGTSCDLRGEGCEAAATHPSWVAIDETRNVAEFRRLDNERYPLFSGKGIKAWSTAGKSWPLGAAQVEDKRRVLLVEGGPDMLAAYHLLRMYRQLDRVAVVCMLGASNRMREDAMENFAGCRVRIMVDADLPKDDPVKHKRKLVGLEAAQRWTNQLTTAGAAVEWFYVGDIYNPDDVGKWHAGEMPASEIRVETPGFVMPDGSKAKDVNNLVECGAEVVACEDVKQAMTAWDF